MARQSEPEKKRLLLLELVDKKELELVDKTIWKRRMRDTNIL